MSQEFDDVTHAFAELLSKLQSANDNDKQAAITFAIDSLLMALGSLEHRLDALEQSNGITRGMSFGVSACQEKKDGSGHRGRAGREGLTRADRATSLARRSSHYRLGPLGLPDCPGFQRVGSLISVMCGTCFHLISALRRDRAQFRPQIDKAARPASA